MKVAFATLGCKLNQFETQVMRELLEKENHEVIPFPEVADLYVINTCTVTGKSDYRSRQAIRRAIQANPQATIVAVGCYAQVNPQEIARLEGVDLILGNQEKFQLPALLDALRGKDGPQIHVAGLHRPATLASPAVGSFAGYTRAFVKVQDGCDASCAFCLVSKARGPNRSERPELVWEQVGRLAEAGYQEVVLTGVHLGSYGADLGEGISLAGLLRHLRRMDRLQKIRLSSIEPREFTEELIEEIATHPKICRHLHIPLQSGDPEILRLMRRNYDPAYYGDLIQRLKVRMPDLGLGADVIVGFPGEEESHFQHTYALIEGLPLTYLHVFRFSPRPGTIAATLPKQVPGEVKRERSQRLTSLGRRKSLEFKWAQLGKVVEVLIETTPDRETGSPKGITENYLKVLLPQMDPARADGYKRVKLVQLSGDKILGEEGL
ncbi:MAG: tRNA (N(6)-L-threonylcarbamoyladenosine(37)-C(2))-methylthiotransferase MtaB [Candidatus Tectomicrobia bacterium]|uniref:Threonylcarbamoyladenosine tRNA methylthiotransferase MtaB n=1 Tax=Tectimicrobiota bacterium TaxID=2528274 RepID=A0A932CPI1_UNCTE|nr:tRNA (N(6)-L-threonylcarbamoyladenosine(37)-C(2))-methylthiotransferase MtaB [Candidatus Tectomicrobia bacterium]